MIQADPIREALRRCLGSVLEDDALVEGIRRVLEDFHPGKDTYSDLAGRMEHFLFNSLYDRLGPGMSFRSDDGSRCRILLSDLPLLADQMLFPLFMGLKPWSVDYERLYAWWMETGSWSAMFALMLVFRDFLPPQDRLVISRVIRENVPVRLWPAGLSPLIQETAGPAWDNRPTES